MANVLLEASAMGRPVLASNIPGCRETFDEGESGFGFEYKSVNSLFETVIKFFQLPYEEKRKMGQRAREKMIGEFDRQLVVAKYIEIISAIAETHQINR